MRPNTDLKAKLLVGRESARLRDPPSLSECLQEVRDFDGLHRIHKFGTNIDHEQRPHHDMGSRFHTPSGLGAGEHHQHQNDRTKANDESDQLISEAARVAQHRYLARSILQVVTLDFRSLECSRLALTQILTKRPKAVQIGLNHLSEQKVHELSIRLSRSSGEDAAKCVRGRDRVVLGCNGVEAVVCVRQLLVHPVDRTLNHSSELKTVERIGNIVSHLVGSVWTWQEVVVTHADVVHQTRCVQRSLIEQRAH
ncbi:hypothetical protein PAQ31011_05098 [Pandoraea aquatica]|uniref:Uncharacterized protein n=1 Tax=Pandoraea aquatica TaxID=2508290 RepID=A0A5E4Z7G3_9BURK|nr:hypothetical protein PAQ31011_05098 [Pandoraea aquatica]